jgi:hypothetical protein
LRSSLLLACCKCGRRAVAVAVVAAAVVAVVTVAAVLPVLVQCHSVTRHITGSVSVVCDASHFFDSTSNSAQAHYVVYETAVKHCTGLLCAFLC